MNPLLASLLGTLKWAINTATTGHLQIDSGVSFAVENGKKLPPA